MSSGKVSERAGEDEWVVGREKSGFNLCGSHMSCCLVHSVMVIALLSNITSIAYTFGGLWAATDLKVGFFTCKPRDLVGVGVAFFYFFVITVVYMLSPAATPSEITRPRSRGGS